MKDFILLLLLFYVFYFIKKKIDYFKIMRDGEKEGRKKKEKPNPAFPLLGRKEMILLWMIFGCDIIQETFLKKIRNLINQKIKNGAENLFFFFFFFFLLLSKYFHCGKKLKFL